mmetsp:Transcript_12503/g.25821  ORF Transcript_12503/g.25821 Transcript_12503/m.25821 type:complete len:83 (-) Transcript_12503:160-408(-)
MDLGYSMEELMIRHGFTGDEIWMLCKPELETKQSNGFGAGVVGFLFSFLNETYYCLNPKEELSILQKLAADIDLESMGILEL